MSEFVLQFGQCRHDIERKIAAECDRRFAFGHSFTAFGGDDDHTIGCADSVKCRSRLSFQNVDTFNVVRVDIYRAVGKVHAAYTTVVLYVRIYVRSTGHCHSVDYVKRRVISGERTCATDRDL